MVTLGLFKKLLYLLLLWQLLETFWQLLISTSGHTEFTTYVGCSIKLRRLPPTLRELLDEGHFENSDSPPNRGVRLLRVALQVPRQSRQRHVPTQRHLRRRLQTSQAR